METQKEQELHKEIMNIIKTGKYDTKTLYKELKLFSIYFGFCFLSEHNIIDYNKFNDEIKKDCLYFDEIIDKDLETDINEINTDIDNDLKKCHELLEEIKKIKNNINGV